MKLNRRKFLALLGLTPAVAALPQLATAAHKPQPIPSKKHKGGDTEHYWCRFDGVTGEMIEGHGVAGVKKRGTGHYFIGFASPQPDTNFAVQLANGQVAKKTTDLVELVNVKEQPYPNHVTVFRGHPS